MTNKFASRYLEAAYEFEKFLKMRQIGCISWNAVHLRCIANLTSYYRLTALLMLKAGQFFCWRLPSEAIP